MNINTTTETGEFAVWEAQPGRRPGAGYDANSDREIVWHGRYWPGNLEGSPEKPRRLDRYKFLGRRAVRRLFDMNAQ